MKEIYDESGALTGYLVSPDECICKFCNISIYSTDCNHSDVRLIDLKKFTYRFDFGAQVHWKEDGEILVGIIENRYGGRLYTVRVFSASHHSCTYKDYFNIPEEKLHHL